MAQLYSKTLHKLYTICFWNHSVSPISLLYIHMYLLYRCTPCVYFVVVKGTNIFQELVHADVKNMSVKAVGNKNVTVCNTLHVL
jgi:hypothetical protein